MDYLDNLKCGCHECHFNQDNFCYRESVTLDMTSTCEDMETCEDYECLECDFFDFCSKEKKYNSAAFSTDRNFFAIDE